MRKLTKLFVASLSLVAFSAASYAADAKTEAYYKVSKVTVKEVVPTAAEIASGYVDMAAAPQEGLIEELANIDWNAMVLVGQKVIELVKAGAPVVNIKRDTVSVMPMGVQTWQQLAGWQAPVTKAYNVTITNYLGMNVVDLRLKVSGMWGGNVDGKGQYLANVMVVPASTRVLWGWTLDLWTENREPVNTGSVQAPRAGLGFDIRYKATTPLNELNGTQDYFITGDGKIQAL
jgi:hypothetical protein